MLKKVLKWAVFVIVSLVVVVAIVAFSLISSTNNKMNKAWQVAPASIVIPTDSASLERGMRLANVLCLECHGEGFGGKVFMDDPTIGRIDAHNLTSGKGGVGGKYTDADWIRAIRHGLTKEGRPIFIMPSNDFHHMSERDLAELVAYIKTIPPVDKEWMEKPQLKPMAKILAALGAFGHCHGMELNGGPSTIPNSPFSPNITPGGNLASWSEADFSKAMRTGWTPEGKQLSDYYMPWKATMHLSDLEMTAVYNYLKSLPTLETAAQ